MSCLDKFTLLIYFACPLRWLDYKYSLIMYNYKTLGAVTIKILLGLSWGRWLLCRTRPSCLWFVRGDRKRMHSDLKKLLRKTLRGENQIESLWSCLHCSSLHHWQRSVVLIHEIAGLLRLFFHWLDFVLGWNYLIIVVFDQSYFRLLLCYQIY